MGKSRTSGISKTGSSIGIGGGGGAILMGGGGTTASFSQASVNAQPITELEVDGATPQQVATNLQSAKINNANFKDTDDADYHQLYNGRQYYQNQAFSIDQRVANMNYLSDVAQANGFSISQNMNKKLNDGKPLNANEQFMYNGLSSAMHNLGYNLTLQRYDHEDALNSLLNSVGINKSYENLTESQLKSALVGVNYQTRSFTSTSYNDFAKAGSNADWLKSRAVKYIYSAKAKTQALMVGNGHGGNFGEIVLGNTNNYKITDIKFDGRQAKYARSSFKSGTPKSVLVYVDVE